MICFEKSSYLALTGLAINERCLIRILLEHLGHLTPGKILSSPGVISFLHRWHTYFVIEFHILLIFLIFSVAVL